MEDAYANLYDVRADMDLRKQRKRGEERGLSEKFIWGALIFIFLMLCIFLPMLLFSTFNPSLIENKILGGQFSINYVIKNTENNLTTYSLNLFETKNMKINDIKDTREYDYLKKTLISHADDVDERKIQKIQIVNYSQQDWIISPPTIFNLIEHLEKKDKDSYIVFKWEFRRHFPLNNKIIAGSQYVKLKSDQVYAFKNIMYALRNGDKNLNKYNFDLSCNFFINLKTLFQELSDFRIETSNT